MSEPPRLFTVVQAAEKLGLSVSQTRHLATVLSVGIKLGRQWFFTPDDIARMKCRPPPGRPYPSE